MSNYTYFGSPIFYFFSPVSTFPPLWFSLDCYISRACTFLCHLCRYVAQEGVEAFCSQGQYKMMPFRVRGRKWQSGWGSGKGPLGVILQWDAAGMAGQGHEDELRPKHQPTGGGAGGPVAEAWLMAVGTLPMAKGSTQSPKGPSG